MPSRYSPDQPVTSALDYVNGFQLDLAKFKITRLFLSPQSKGASNGKMSSTLQPPPGADVLALFRERRGVLSVIGVAGLAALAGLAYFLAGVDMPTGKAGLLGGAGIALGVGGLFVSVAGFSFTLLQLSQTVGSVESAVLESERIRNSLIAQSAAQDVSRATYALSAARKHFKNSAWADGADSYEDFRRSLVSLSSSVDEMNEEAREKINKASDYIIKLCVRIEKHIYSSQAGPTSTGSTSLPDYSKMIVVLRDHDKLVSEIGTLIDSRIFNVNQG